ncbi:MAG: dehydrogenase E1 component subunit alpha/beta [Acidobacteriota bacterium]|nr:dehydrogenase E1 component subunit alpha/beta [Acidobacteriota bacterium]
MASKVLQNGALSTTEKLYEGFTSQQLVEYFRLMVLSRRIDDREIMLKRQQKIYFQISCAGHEALQVAVATQLRPGYDWAFPYYRDRALCLTLGVTAEAMLLQAVGAADDPASGGRQMPSHWGDPRLNIFTTSSPTGTQFVQAVGCAQAGRYYQDHPASAAPVEGDYRQFKNVRHHGDEVTVVGTGEGTTSQGEFWEALNSAANNRLPVLFLVEDNGYAISVPVKYQTPGGSISQLVRNFPNMLVEECDGTDLLASLAAARRAVEHIREGKGPALLHGHVIRPYSHSLSDDEKLYRPDAERRKDAERDPIARLQKFLIAEGILDSRTVQKMQRDLDAEVQQAADNALAAAFPAKDSYALHVYSEGLSPKSAQFATEPVPEGTERTMADLINHTLSDEMKRDERIVIFGEDVADCSNEEYLEDKKLKGKGGVFKLTHDLQRQFGSDRVFNSPLAEANIVGRALGMAVRGMKPVVEIQFFDYIWPAMHQLRNEVPLIRWRSNNGFSCPLVVRVAIGGYLTGGAVYHSQCGESIFTHTPGMHVVFPSNALDAAGLLRTAIRCDDPVLFLEHKRLYRESFGRGPYPGPEYAIPFGKARIWKEGTDVTLVTYGATVPRSLQAAQRLEREHGISVEVIDLRTLNPYDFEAIAKSVTKTSRVLIVHEDMQSWGYGAEIAARIASELFDKLDAPVQRLAAKDTFVAYQPELEDVILPQADDIFEAVRKLRAY